MKRKRTCGRCPKRDENGICVIRAKWMSSLHPSCAYGRKLMRNAYVAEWMRERYKARKGADKK